MKEETKNTIRYISRWAIRIFLIALISTSIQSCAKAASFSVSTVQNTVNYLKGEGYLPNFSSTDIKDSRNYINNNSFKSYAILTTNSTVILALSWNNTINSQSDCAMWNLDGSNHRDNRNWANISFDSIQMAFSPYGIPIFSIPANEIYDKNKPKYVELEYVNSFDGKYYQNFLYYTYQGDVYQQNKLKIGEIIQNDAYYAEVRLRRGKEENNVIIGTSFISFGNNVYNDGALYYEDENLYLNTVNINYGQPYRLEIQGYYGDGGDNLSEDIDWYLFLPVTANISGDNILSLGSGDFNIQDNASQIMQNQEAQNNWWKQTINDMFVVSGEEIQKIIDDTMAELKIESGEIQEATRILTYLDSQPGDFIVSWGNLTTHFSISGEQMEQQLVIPAKAINFSEMERNSEELHETMNWARIITNISIFSILMHQMYICFIATLGVPVYLYGQKQEEKAQIAKQEEAKKQEQARQEANWNSALEKQKYNEWLYNHRKR